jgi:Dolichyl-phosphate-mannose-protein mannosyltransferase
MNINTNTVSEDLSQRSNKKTKTLPLTHKETFWNQASPPIIEGTITSGLALVALIPRVILAHQLDLVTDEIIYIMAGKTYFPLLLHLRITTNQWSFNYEHPPLIKLLIGLSLFLNAHMGSLLNELFAARTPSILCGTALIVAIYWLGRAPFGRIVALLAALCLAVSPWLVYFSALAYLDITMTLLITLAYLLLWPAIRQPRFYLLSAVLLGLGIASKYTAILALPGMIFFSTYYFLAIRPRLDIEQRPPVAWKWWLMAFLLIPVTFFLADPAIWRQPYNLLLQSVLYEWHHSVTGHLTFLAGQYSGHVPQWAVLYIIFAKLSIFVTVPAVFFLIYTILQLVRFHLKKSGLQVTEVTNLAFLGIWLVSIVTLFSLLNIVVGTHYLLPLAPPTALAGAYGIILLGRFCSKAPVKPIYQHNQVRKSKISGALNPVTPAKQRTKFRTVVVAVLFVLFIGSHFLGLLTTYAAEGYTSEIFPGENTALQVAYPGYREAALWLTAHSHSSGRVGIVALLDTLNHGDYHTSWYSYNHDLQGRLTYSEVQPTSASFPFDYLVWPMHLIQRGYTIPGAWRAHVVQIIMGGNTIYCFILAKTPAILI